MNLAAFLGGIFRTFFKVMTFTYKNFLPHSIKYLNEDLPVYVGKYILKKLIIDQFFMLTYALVKNHILRYTHSSTVWQPWMKSVFGKLTGSPIFFVKLAVASWFSSL